MDKDKSTEQKQMNKDKQPSDKDNQFTNKLFKSLDKNIENFKSMMNAPSDLVLKKFKVGGTTTNCAVFCIDGLSNGQYIAENIVNSILSFDIKSNSFRPTPDQILEDLKYRVMMTADDITVKTTLDDVTLEVLSGNTAVLVDGCDKVLIASSMEVTQRSLEEPITEALVRGPRIGFIENLRMNTTLVRRGIRDPNLRIKSIITTLPKGGLHKGYKPKLPAG
ncbi:spore germination protein, partial [Pullulanibacillus pueri]